MSELTQLNKGEIGQVIRVNAGTDITSAISIDMKLVPEFGEIKIFTATVGVGDVEEGNETFTSGEYAEYTTVLDTDLDYAGRWKKRIEVVSINSTLKTNFESFRVLG